MTCRVEDGVTYKLDYNTENRISAIHKMDGDCATGTILESWVFGYDGDGVRVSTAHFTGTTADSLTSYYFGGAYEVTGSTIRKYYGFAGQTIAVRTWNVELETWDLSYFLTDHLGSIVAVTDAIGTLTSQQRYLPFGEVRTDVGTISQTDYGYTGQRNLGDMGLMDYKARFYSSSLMRFIQPDTMIPDLTNPQAWNRFSYVVNRPVVLNDPTGHSFSPNCAICTLDIDYSNITGGWNTFVDWASSGACFVAGCHVDRENDKITGPTSEEWLTSGFVGMATPVNMPASKISQSVGKLSDDVIYSGVRKASQFLQDIGVPRGTRKQIIESFNILSINVRTAQASEYGLRYFDNIVAKERGRYLFLTLPASRNELALLPEFNQMTYIKQWQIRPGATIIEGITAPKGIYRGGLKQIVVPNFLDDLLEIQ